MLNCKKKYISKCKYYNSVKPITFCPVTRSEAWLCQFSRPWVPKYLKGCKGNVTNSFWPVTYYDQAYTNFYLKYSSQVSNRFEMYFELLCLQDRGVTIPQNLHSYDAEDRIFGLLDQYHACWLPGFWSRQSISRHGIDSAEYAACSVAAGWI